MAKGQSGTAYALTRPVRRDTALVFASPHSGRDYPADFLQDSALDEATIRSSEDAFVDELWAAAPRFGAPLLAAKAPRAFLDLNRAADEFDPALVEGVRRISHNPRIASGLGVIPRVVAGGRAIRAGKIPMKDAHDRIRTYWHPYHRALQDLIDESRRRFGEAILIDCHSMPHEAIEPVGGARPDVVLGDRFGASAGPGLVDEVEGAFADAGFRTARNAPFAGAFIVQQYGRPSRGQHAIQVEIDRGLYMDEAKIRPSDQFEETRARLTRVAERLCEIGRRSMAVAAE